MASGIGYSFEPGANSVPVSGSNKAINGPQSAVEVRSLTLPNRFVPGQIAPQALLQSAGGGGAPELAVLRQLIQAFAPQGQQPGVPSLMPPPQPRYHTQPVPMPGVGPNAGGVTYQGGVPAGADVPLQHTPTPNPGVRPGENPETPPVSFESPRVPSQPVEQPNYDSVYHNPANYAKPPEQGAGFVNPLARKFEGYDVPGLFD